MAFARFFSRLQPKKYVEELTPEEFRDKYFQMTAEDIKMLTQDTVSGPLNKATVCMTPRCIRHTKTYKLFLLIIAAIMHLGRW